MMKPPEEIYPKQKAAQFDLYGRPHHPFFFTAKPHFYSLIHVSTAIITPLFAFAPYFYITLELQFHIYRSWLENFKH